MNGPLKILIADDHEIFRDGFKVMLRKQTGVQIIGEAENGQELVEKAGALQPDVVITDIKMPVLDGVAATKQIRALYKHIEVIALSMFDEESLIMEMLEAGAKGYLLKNTNKAEVVEAVTAVYNKENFFSGQTSKKLAQLIARSRLEAVANSQKPSFNNNELEIIKLICAEQNNREIAMQLNLSVRTVEGYREKILEKIDAKNVAGLVIYAIKHGIYQVP